MQKAGAAWDSERRGQDRVAQETKGGDPHKGPYCRGYLGLRRYIGTT